MRITFAERPHAPPGEVVAIAARMPTGAGLMILTAAYSGLRRGELAGLPPPREVVVRAADDV